MGLELLGVVKLIEVISFDLNFTPVVMSRIESEIN